MKVRIDNDELYPFFIIGKYGKEVEISEEQMKKYERILKEFLEMQEELEELWENAEEET